MNGLSVKFNGVELSEYLTVTSLQRDVGAEKVHKTIKVGNSDGEKYLGSTNEKKKIPMSFTFIYDLVEKRRKLADLLNVNEPKMLIFGDEPDKYYMATPDGQTSLEEFVYHGNGTITWLVPDGVAHAVEEKTVSADTDNKITFSNEGSYKTFPILEATMKSDNGVVAFINSNGALLQFGNPSEVDTVGYQRSEWLVSDKDMTKENVEASGWKVNDVTFKDHMDRKVVANGDVLYKTVLSDGRTAHAVGIGDFGSGTEYHGASLSRLIAADSEGHIGAKNFEAHFSVYFATGRINQTGLSIIDVRDSKGKSIAGVSFTKNSSTNNISGLRLHLNGKVVYTQWFNTTVWNIYTKLGATFYIYKSGGYFEFHMGGIINGGFAKTFRDESLAEVEVTELVWFGGIYGNSTSTLENYLISASFLKNNVDKVADIPNRFGNGDKLTVDVGSATVYLNDLEMNGFGALGNDYEQFFLEPGENEILCICSDWVDQENFPEIIAKYREAYL